jgi:hypothetical protein
MIINMCHNRWYKEDESGLISAIVSTPYMQIYDAFLIINQVLSHDSGKWICAANNTVGEEKVSIKLMVITPIVVKIEPDILVADIGKGATFNCSLTGNPINFHVIWLKDGRPLITDGFSGPINDGRIRLIQPTLLNIRNVVREDAGQSFFYTYIQLNPFITPSVITEHIVLTDRIDFFKN